MVHAAFKGIRFPKEGTDNWLRLHLHATPHGRCTVWHSFEQYTLDTAGNVSFWQGWIAFGAVAQGGGVLAGNGLATSGVAHFITGADTIGQGETWYAGEKFAAPWRWDFVIVINDPPTLYNAGECSDPMNMATWEMTGDFGLSRTLVHAMYYGSGSVRYPFRDTPRGWFCATQQGEITSTGSKACGSGSLPQYVAPTMPALETVAPVARTYACPACVMPN